MQDFIVFKVFNMWQGRSLPILRDTEVRWHGIYFGARNTQEKCRIYKNYYFSGWNWYQRRTIEHINDDIQGRGQITSVEGKIKLNTTTTINTTNASNTTTTTNTTNKTNNNKHNNQQQNIIATTTTKNNYSNSSKKNTNKHKTQQTKNTTTTNNNRNNNNTYNPIRQQQTTMAKA